MRYSTSAPNVKDGRILPSFPRRRESGIVFPAATLVAVLIAMIGCATPSRHASVAAAGQLSATSSVRINVINFTTLPAPFLFRFGGIQMLDSIAPPGSLGVPVLSRSLQVAPGLYRMQLFDKRTQKIAQDSLESGGKGADFSTIELIFDNDVWSITTCHCSRIYGRGGGTPPS